jgi:hypothetical protein
MINNSPPNEPVDEKDQLLYGMKYKNRKIIV